MEASDIRGLPNPGEDGRTHYLPPADMPVGDQTPEQIGEELGKPPKEGDMEAERKFYLELANKLESLKAGGRSAVTIPWDQVVYVILALLQKWLTK